MRRKAAPTSGGSVLTRSGYWQLGFRIGSVCGLLVALAIVGLLILRIFGEEKLLARDLEGYNEFPRRCVTGRYHTSGDHPQLAINLSWVSKKSRRLAG